MGLSNKIETEDGLIGIWKLEESPEELLPLITLSADDERKYKAITHKNRQCEFLASRLLLNDLLNRKPEIHYDEKGKPELKNTPLNISISHSGNFACVFLSEKRIGIDIELAMRSIDRVATRFLHFEEKEHISKLNNQQLAKIIYWSAKEAIFKSSDTQGIQFNQQIRIENFDPEQDRSFFANLHLPVKSTHFQLHYLLVENNVLVYCVED